MQSKPITLTPTQHRALRHVRAHADNRGLTSYDARVTTGSGRISTATLARLVRLGLIQVRTDRRWGTVPQDFGITENGRDWLKAFDAATEKTPEEQAAHLRNGWGDTPQPQPVEAVTPKVESDPRNPAVVHYEGTDGNAACGLAARALDGTAHRAVSFNGDEDATCSQCVAYAQDVTSPPAAPEFEDDLVLADRDEFRAITALRDASGDLDKALEAAHRSLALVTSAEDKQSAVELVRALEDVKAERAPMWPRWTREYKAYAAKLRTELAKFAAGQMPHDR